MVWFNFAITLYYRFEQKLERIAVERGRRRTKSIEQEPGPGDESPSKYTFVANLINRIFSLSLSLSLFLS